MSNRKSKPDQFLKSTISL